MEKYELNLNSALEIKKRQHEVEKRLRELGIKLFFLLNKAFRILKFYFN
jgi:hypothetical protein